VRLPIGGNLGIISVTVSDIAYGDL